MRVTRRGLFATIAAAFVAKPAIKDISITLLHAVERHLVRCECPGCQYARGVLTRVPTYEFYPDVFTAPPNQLLTVQEIASKSLQVLEKNTVVLPSFYRE